jgi:predicted phage-related endonuclease
MHEIAKQVADYTSLKKTMNELAQKLEAVEGEIKAYMGEQEELVVDGVTVRWKKIMQNRFDAAEFKRQHTALYEQFLKQGEIRRFTVT